MQLYTFLLLYLYGTFSILFAEYREDTFLFCLKPEYSPLIINREAGEFNSGIEDMDRFLDSNPISDIEPWLRNTTPEENSGDIYLNRIYRIHLMEDKAGIRDQLKDDLSALPVYPFCRKRAH